MSRRGAIRRLIAGIAGIAAAAIAFAGPMAPCALAAGTVAAGQVTELRPFRDGGWLHASVRARDLLDDRTRSTIDSGLPGTCIFEIRVEDRAGNTVAERYIERTLRFDVWEELYRLEENGQTITLETAAAADSALSVIAACALCPFERLRTGAEYRVGTRIAVRPLAPEDRRRLSSYVSRTSAGDGEEVALDLRAVFGPLLGESESSRAVIREWTPYFRPEEIGGPP